MTTALRLRPRTKCQIDAISAHEDRPMVSIVQAAIDEYIAARPELHFIRDASARQDAASRPRNTPDSSPSVDNANVPHKAA